MATKNLNASVLIEVPLDVGRITDVLAAIAVCDVGRTRVTDAECFHDYLVDRLKDWGQFEVLVHVQCLPQPGWSVHLDIYCCPWPGDAVSFARRIAAEVGSRVLVDDGTLNPWTFVLARPDGSTAAASIDVEAYDEDRIVLDEPAA